MSKKYYKLTLNGKDRSIHNIDVHTPEKFIGYYFNYCIEILTPGNPAFFDVKVTSPQGDAIISGTWEKAVCTIDTQIEFCVDAILKHYEDLKPIIL